MNWHLKAIQNGGYYKIIDNDQIVGGMRVLLRDGNECHLSPIYLDPDAQNRGIGSQAMAFLESAYPDAHTWTLDTPDWATRNRHFYEKTGYRCVKVEDGFVFYEKSMRPD